MDYKQMIATVQIYIHIRTGKEVNIRVSGLMEMLQLKTAYDIALEWLQQNNTKIKRA